MTDLNAELRAAVEELVSATINLATPYGRLEQQPTTTEFAWVAAIWRGECSDVYRVGE